jgi:protein TonB
MLDQLLVGEPRLDGHRSWATVSVSLAIHLLIFGCASLAALLAVGPIQEPDLRLISIQLRPPRPPVAAAPLPTAGAASRSQDLEKKEQIPREDLPEMIQPEKIPEVIPAFEESEEEGWEDGFKDGISGGVPGGHRDGIPGGHRDGVPGGEVGGDPNGIPWGLGSDSRNSQPKYLTGEILKPERIVYVEPGYPRMARAARAEGRVILEIIVNTGGDVESVRILSSHPLFDGAAIDAVRQWRYAPALQNGTPVKVYMTVIVDFKLE